MPNKISKFNVNITRDFYFEMGLCWNKITLFTKSISAVKKKIVFINSVPI